MIREVDTDDTGTLDFPKFLKIMSRTARPTDSLTDQVPRHPHDLVYILQLAAADALCCCSCSGGLDDGRLFFFH